EKKEKKTATNKHRETHIITNFIRPFDLSRAPLLRGGLIKKGNKPITAPETANAKPPAEYLLLIDMHHIVSDGVSVGILFNEFTTLYKGHRLQPQEICYKDYTQWLNSPGEKKLREKQKRFWLKEFENEIPVLELLTDNPRTPLQEFDGATYRCEIGAKETAALKAQAVGHGATLFMVLNALINVLLFRISNQEDIIIGTPVAARRHANLENIIGMFVNTLALRNYPVGTKTFTAFVEEVKNQAVHAFENQDYPFGELVEQVDGIHRNTGRNPLFDVMFSMENLERPEIRVPGLTLKPYPRENSIAKFDLMLTAWEEGRKLGLEIEYAAKLFKKETIQRFVTYLKRLAKGISENNNIQLAGVEIIPQEEKRQLLFEFNETTAGYPKEKTIHKLFEEQEERHSDAKAIITETTAITYGRLNEKANQIANVLIEKGVTAETVVAIMAERSLEMVAGIFGILKAGGAYLPISPDAPGERIAFMLRDSNAKMVLTQKEVTRRQEENTGPINEGKENTEPQKGNGEIMQPGILYLEELLKDKPVKTSKVDGVTGTGKKTQAKPQPRTQSSNLAYIIYTSGSTGKPKGVLIEHTSVVNILTALHRKYPFTETDTYLFKTSVVFDVSVSEIFGWSLGGGRLALLEREGEKDPARILAAIDKYAVTHINFVPSMFKVFLDKLETEGKTELRCLRYIFLAGEALTPPVVERYRRLTGTATPGLTGRATPGLTGTATPGLTGRAAPGLENIYGPTEATIYASEYSLTQWNSTPGSEGGSGSVPIGKPMQNLGVYILNKYGDLQPLGVAGELCIRGVGLARGYLNRPELTAEKFIKINRQYDTLPLDNQSPITGNRLYKTGDLCRRLPGGNIAYLGRIDHQVKIRGYRIELGEIENQLMTHEKIKEAVVIALTKNSDDTNLCAFYVR
ncbi:MAG: AMP-binding protein, partial [bacterium]|nr:AMP-binding protein [bacterium]